MRDSDGRLFGQAPQIQVVWPIRPHRTTIVVQFVVFNQTSVKSDKTDAADVVSIFETLPDCNGKLIQVALTAKAKIIAVASPVVIVDPKP